MHTPDTLRPPRPAPPPAVPARAPLHTSPDPDPGRAPRLLRTAQLRHRAELPLLIACALLTAVGVGVAGFATVHHLLVPEWAAAALGGLALPVLAATVGIRWLFWRQAANSIEVTSTQLGALHRVHIDLTARLGLPRPPRLLVANGNGTLNAYAAKCRVRHGYIVLYSDLVELAYEQDDWEGLAFMLAHELGHIRCGHVDLWRTAIRALPRLVGLDRSLTRAQEYTADRCAAMLVPAGVPSMLALYAGKRLHRHLDHDAALRTSGGTGVWLALVNLWSSHPVGRRRLHALARTTTEGWDVHGRMA